MRTWRHTCSYLYAGGQRPSPLDLDIRITRCPYCGELEPEHQRELDRQAVAALQASDRKSVV